MRAIIMGISLIATLIAINTYGTAFALTLLKNPPHCDRSGYPSCYSIGYNNGRLNPGTSCPSGHSKNFCRGWNVAANSAPLPPNTARPHIAPLPPNTARPHIAPLPPNTAPGYSTCGLYGELCPPKHLSPGPESRLPGPYTTCGVYGELCK